jgi:signal transduction histidine kinase
MKSLIAYIIFLISLAILVSLSILYTQRFRALTHYTKQVESTYKVLLEFNKLFGYLKDAETGSRGFLLSGDSTFLVPYNTALDSIKPSLQKVYNLAISQPKVIARLNALNILIYERIDIMNHSMLLYSNNRNDFIQVLNRGKEKMTECRNLIATVDREMNSGLLQSQKSKAFYELVTPGFFLIIMGFTAIAFVLSFYVILREYTGRLRYQQDLEKKIVALNMSYQELEQIAYITSHDLQEPLRKISIFCDRLSSKYGTQLDDEGNHIIDRIYQSSTRTRELVGSLSGYTSLTTGDRQKGTVNLQKHIQHVGEKYREHLSSKNATLTVTELPPVQGYDDQLQLLFECLIDNSIKFANPDTKLSIQISQGNLDRQEMDAAKAHTAHHAFTKIIYRDNGVGFDNTFAEKIFSIFQRLNQETDGKGVGLAIVKRVMNNHNGFVVAEGRPNHGATFVLYFPEDDD